METLETKALANPRTSSIRIYYQKIILKSHLRYIYDLRKNLTIPLIEVASYESEFFTKDNNISHALQIFYKGYYINRIIYKLFLLTSCLLIIQTRTNPFAMNWLDWLWLLISFIRNDRDKCTCKVCQARNKISTDLENC